MSRLADRFRSKPAIAAIALTLFAAGGVAGSAVTRATQPEAVMAAAPAIPIGSLASIAQPSFGEAIVTLRGKVAEVYGGRFILADASGRALVEGGRGGEALVTAGQTVTVQGGVRDGVLRARYLIGADGIAVALHGRRDGPRGRPGRHGPDRADVPPPAPAPAGGDPAP